MTVLKFVFVCVAVRGSGGGCNLKVVNLSDQNHSFTPLVWNFYNKHLMANMYLHMHALLLTLLTFAAAAVAAATH